MKKANDYRDGDYYQAARYGSLDLSHPAMIILKEEVKKANRIVDLGCGEGSRLFTLLGDDKTKAGIGVDANTLAIRLATKQYKNIKFFCQNLEKVSLEDESFDLAYSAYVFEHLEEPDKVLKESRRILKLKGRLVIISPNFGAPNRRSPNSEENKFTKLVKGFLRDLIRSSKESHTLDWQRVSTKNNLYTIDADTVIEPYLLSLTQFCKSLGFEVIKSTSCWECDSWSVFQLPFKIFGSLGIYPFLNWGPHLCLVLRKDK